MKTIEISDEQYAVLEKLASELGGTIGSVLDDLIGGAGETTQQNPLRLTPEEGEIFKSAVADLDAGNAIPHEQIVRDIAKRLGR